MKQIKISEETREKLDNTKQNKESYNNLIFRVMNENDELKKDKEFLTEVIRKLLLSYVLRMGKEDIPSQDDLMLVLKSLLTQE